MDEILNFKRDHRSRDELGYEPPATVPQEVEDVQEVAEQYLTRAREVANLQRQLRAQMFQRLRDRGVHVSVAREDVRQQLRILRHAGGKQTTVPPEGGEATPTPPDELSAPFVDFDDFVYQLDVLQQTIPPYEVVYAGMDPKPIPTRSGLVYVHRDGTSPILITASGDVQLCPDEQLPDELAERSACRSTKKPCSKDRFKEICDKYMTSSIQKPNLNVEFDKNVCKDSIQTTDSFVLRLLMNNYSELDLLSVLGKWFLCPLEKTINDIIDQWNAVASFLLKIFVPIFNQHVHTTPLGPTSPPTQPVLEYDDIPKWYKLPHVCFVEEFAYKVEKAKREKLCVKPFLNKTYSCGDGRQICQFLAKYSDELAYEIVGQHSDDPKVKRMRNSGQWKKFALYSPHEANFVLMKVKELSCSTITPLDADTFDRLKFLIQPIVGIPDDVFLFCGDFASGMISDISKLVDYADAIENTRNQMRQFYAKCRAGSVGAEDVSVLQSVTYRALKKGYIQQQDVDRFVDYLRDAQVQQSDNLTRAVEQLKLALKIGQSGTRDQIQSALNAQFITGSSKALEQILQSVGAGCSPKASSFDKLVQRVQQLFGVSVQQLTGGASRINLDQLHACAHFIHTYRQMKKQLYPLHGSGAVDNDVLQQVQQGGVGCGSSCPKAKGR